MNRKIASEQPLWYDFASNPTLSAREALRIAERFRQERFIDWGDYDWSLEHVALTPLDIKSRRWCWIVLFRATFKPGVMGGGGWPEFPVYVLMDGTVIEPSDPRGFLKPKDVDKQID